jgi:hypothetical protein
VDVCQEVACPVSVYASIPCPRLLTSFYSNPDMSPDTCILFFSRGKSPCFIHLKNTKYNSQCPSLLAVRVRRLCDFKKVKLNSDDGDLGSKICKRVYGDAYGGVWRNLRVARIWPQLP